MLTNVEVLFIFEKILMLTTMLSSNKNGKDTLLFFGLYSSIPSSLNATKK